MAASLADTSGRVMGLVWRTRSILILRVRIANVARECPRMEDIPHLPDAEADWEAVAVRFLAFRRRVRQSIADVRTAESNIALSLPTVPGRATIEEGERKRVRAELDRALGTLDSIRGRLEKLSDTVGYLADRCRTREVVEAAPVEISAGGDAEEILHLGCVHAD